MNIAKYFLILTFALCSTGWAQLRWEKRSLEFNPSPSDEKVVADFHFTNIGTKPIKIKEVKTSCGCTTATLDKDVYAPGEKGKITAIFDIGGRTGVQEKTIYVATNDSKEPELVLQFKATIPKLLDIDNIFLNWQRGEALTPKIVNIKVSGDYPIHHLDVTSTKPEMVAVVKHVEGTRDFQIIVTPKKTDAELDAGLEIKPDYPKNPPKYFHIYTRVDH
jgi:hypothetical protein